MFQTFDAPADPVTGNARLEDLRYWMKQQSVSVILVPHNDEQNNEYLPVDKERLAWICGFTGSAGTAVITLHSAFLFVDGRYTLQANEQADREHWTVKSLIDTPPHKWLQANVSSNDTIGFDPWLHTAAQVKQLQNAADTAGCQLNELSSNPVDAIWSDQPPAPLGPVRLHDISFAGKPALDKLQDVKRKMAESNAELCILTDPASACWLLNIRGKDVAHTPITLAHVILRKDSDALLFVDQSKLDDETRDYLAQICSIRSPSQLAQTVSELSAGAAVMLDGSISPFAFNRLVEGAGGRIIDTKDPVSLARATKNEVELAGSRTAHRRDGVAMTSFLAWLDAQPPGSVDEITAARTLEQFRIDLAGNMPLRDISFDTISGSGPNGAIVHYRVNEKTNRRLLDGEIYLTDSGGQYDDGTTDITRTVAIGEVDGEMRRAYTLVLRGHIAIALARFPKGTRGVDIDVLARMALWQHGMDYAHGTGHGVGSYLAVHEGPQNISRRGMQEFLPGMIISNEPGYYRTNKFGIRIENLVVVREEMDIVDGDQPMMGFDTITLAPLDQRLIDPTMLTDDELHWLNAYHGWVRRELEPLVNEDIANWLRKATQPMIRILPPASA
jgi:Xaa-Pro aminopeptidase